MGMLRKNSGITLVALVITVIVLMIIAGVMINMGTNMIDAMGIQEINTNMMLVQARIKQIAEKNSFSPTENELKGQPVNSVTNETVTLNIADALDELAAIYPDKPEYWDSYNDYYYFDSSTIVSELGIEGVLSDKKKDCYVVNYKTKEIIYLPGYKHSDGNVYYSLSKIKTFIVVED